MNRPSPIVLERGDVRLEPMAAAHAADLSAAAADGQLWDLWFTSVPEPSATGQYIADALAGLTTGSMLPWVVRLVSTGEIVGTTRYHDIVTTIDRVEIGYTWYASRVQRTQVNTICKLLLLEHAFERLGCAVVGLRTDNFNLRSQRAIESLGARRDGVIRHHAIRRDGSVRDTVMYSILVNEWPDVRKHLHARLARLKAGRSASTGM